MIIKSQEKDIIDEYTKENVSMDYLAKKYHTSWKIIKTIISKNNIKLHCTNDTKIGDVYGYLTVIEKIPNPSSKYTDSYYKCKCVCGNEIKIARRCLLIRKNKSCGCIPYKRSAKNRLDYHGHINHPVYKAWVNMKSRCYNSHLKAYRDYGGRGIKVCEEWQDFKNFWYWACNNGYKDGYTIERIDVNKGYNPENCKWIPRSSQNWNRRNTRYVTYKGISKSVGEWRSILGVKHYILYNFVKRNNWQLEPFLKAYNITIPDNVLSS